MDIQYLLWLQELKQALPSSVEQFFVIVSAIAASSALIIIPCILYWCLDKRAGQSIVFGFAMGSLCNQFLKNTVACYRPWVRSTAIHPTEAALPEATGYSFPSGHTQGATSLFGGLGWYLRKTHLPLSILCWAFVLLVGISRNFLGVHTPQDVIVALLEGIASVALGELLINWAGAQEGRDTKVLVIGVILATAFLVFVTVKPYPIDYDATGALLVDPVAMQVDCYKSGGLALGLVTGWYLERRKLSFVVDSNALGWKGIARRLFVGIVVVLAFHLAPRLLASVLTDQRCLELIKYFLTAFAAVFAAPLAFCAVERRRTA